VPCSYSLAQVRIRRRYQERPLFEKATKQFFKQFNSSFERTSLEQKLAGLSATPIALAGAATNWGIRATAYAAPDRGYDLTLIRDAHATDMLELENGIRIEAADVVRELNIAMTWLSYPGRTNGTTSVDDVDFAVPGGVR
jgi:hypothetical protein